MISSLKGNRLITVFGCRGDEDRGRRPFMAAAANQSDLLIITNDSPRSEPPEQIVQVRCRPGGGGRGRGRGRVACISEPLRSEPPEQIVQVRSGGGADRVDPLKGRHGYGTGPASAGHCGGPARPPPQPRMQSLRQPSQSNEPFRSMPGACRTLWRACPTA